MQKTWNVKKPDINLQNKLSKELGISTLLAQLLINRKIKTSQEAERFLACRLSDLYDPFLFKGMQKAVTRIRKAVEDKEKIVIWGDYDVDGLTSVALLKTVLTDMGAAVEHYIPHRTEEGYGLNSEGLEKICKTRASTSAPMLVITVDCGVTSKDEVELLKEKGIDIIITDHHQPMGDYVPDAYSVINPLQKDCNYPFKYLAGVGIAFKLAQAITGKDLFEHIDLVALGTISDIVPMRDENRIFVKHGLAQLTKTKKAGLVKLLDKVGIKDKNVTTMHAGFLLGPRLNATGRIGSSESSLKLLMTKSDTEAVELAQRLNDANRLRQQLEAKTLAEALAKIEREINFKEHKVIVLHKDDWHPGVIGIVASRIVERFYRPAILLASQDDGLLKGSGRSIDNFHLFNALVKCKALLREFGGHSKACGLSMDPASIDDFRDAMNVYADEMVSLDAFTPALEIDAEIPLSLLNEGFVEQISLLGPFGQENPRPVFATKAVGIKTKPKICARNTLKMWVSDGDITCEAVGFKMAEAFALDCVPELIDIVYTAAINEWKGTRSIELNLKDLRECSKQLLQPCRV